MKSYFLILLLGICLVACAKTDIKPTITLSRERIPQKGWLKMYGKGFTPKHNVQSHLRRPDGTEFREISILTDAEGGFEHDIDTLLLMRGIHDLWVVDSETGMTSNVAHFEATDDQGPAEKPAYPTQQ